jgi:hypothetical protein
LAALIPDYEKLGLTEFLQTHPRMSIRPTNGQNLTIEGKFDFTANSKEFRQITDYYELQIVASPLFPREVPIVREIRGRIPKNGTFHVNGDGSLCLGSRIRLLWKLSKAPTLEGFAEKCLVPYLFAISHKFIYGGDLPFGELAHGSPGELMDYVGFFGLKTLDEARRALQYLGMKKRRANKLPCACGCGQRLGKCRFNFKLRKFRQLAERSWFRSISSDMPQQKRPTKLSG